MSETATPPADDKKVDGATPESTPEVITLSKEEHDQLARDAARAKAAQRKADLYDKFVGNPGKGHFNKPAPSTPPSQEDMDAKADIEDRKAERGLLALAADPEFREVLDADPTLRNLLLSNPLAILPIYADDAVDAEDALTLVKDALRGLKKPAPTKPADTPVVDPEKKPVPPAGGVNPTAPVSDEYESAKKISNTENAISQMIKISSKTKRG